MSSEIETTLNLLRQTNLPMRTSDFVAAKVSRTTLSRMAANGAIERVGNGLYRLPETTSEYADWAAICQRYPDAVICTQSAAVFHGTTQDLVGTVHVARPFGTGKSALATSLPVSTKVIRMRDDGKGSDPFSYGIGEHSIEGVTVKITDLERTLVDMFKFSSFNRACNPSHVHVGDESFLVCVERTVSSPNFSVDRLVEYARKSHVYNNLKPIITSSLHFASAVPHSQP